MLKFVPNTGAYVLPILSAADDDGIHNCISELLGKTTTRDARCA